jgi:SAM-dependent methyltransferase
MASAPVDYFAGQIAQEYDAGVAASFAATIVDPVVDRLLELAGGGTCLEFAIGTGRIALPLRARGATVEGIEFSADMIAELRKKPDAAEIRVMRGDMSTIDMGKTYTVVFLVFNTIMNLCTQDAQVQCFKNAAKHLDPGGKFVVEVMMPDFRRYPPGATGVPFEVAPQHIGIDTYVVSQQLLTSHHIDVGQAGSARYYSVPFRYVWPAELDLMAQLAGMRLFSRHADWIATPFDDSSRAHVSVWEKM